MSLAQELVDSLDQQQLTAVEVFIMHNQYCMTSLIYILISTSFSTKQIQQIQSPAISTLLKYFHLPRAFPWAVLFDSRSHGGVGLHQLFAKTFVNQLLYVSQQITLLG